MHLPLTRQTWLVRACGLQLLALWGAHETILVWFRLRQRHSLLVKHILCKAGGKKLGSQALRWCLQAMVANDLTRHTMPEGCFFASLPTLRFHSHLTQRTCTWALTTTYVWLSWCLPWVFGESSDAFVIPGFPCAQLPKMFGRLTQEEVHHAFERRGLRPQSQPNLPLACVLG